MIEIADNLWVFDGEAVPFFTLPYTTRMTIVRLSDGGLWVHSPIKLTADIQQKVDKLGRVKYLIAPNHLHHLFLKDWQGAYPQAESFGTKEVQKKRQDIKFDGLFSSEGEVPWEEEIGQVLFTGSAAMEECVFFHKASHTLIVTDLIENFDPKSFPPFKRLIARFSGILAPNGKMPIDWRLSFMFHKKEAREHIKYILNWHPQTIVMAHGLIIKKEAESFLKQSFNWLNL